MFRKIAVALATVAALTGAAHADTKEDAQVLGTSIIMLLSESVCETPLTPLMKTLQLGLLKDVHQRELQVGSAVVINSWNGSKTEMKKWCDTAAKGLKKLEVKANQALSN
jgi:hypothetical protein